jgi:hypothetical protein
VHLRNALIVGFCAGLFMIGAACSDDGAASDDETTDDATDDTGDGSIEIWTATVCTSLSDWLDVIAAIDADAQDAVTLQGTVDRDDTGFDSGDTGTSGDVGPEAGRRILVTLFADAADATDDLVQDLEDAGVPDIEDGDELTELFLENFSNVRDAFIRARDDAEDLPVDDAEDFADAAQSILDDIDIASTDVETAFNEASTELDVSEFEEAFADEDACVAIAEAGGAGV